MIALRRPEGWRRGLTRTAYAAGVATAVLGATLLVRETGLAEPEEAVVMAAEARVLSAPSEEGGLTVFTLHAGTKVRIDRRAGEWVEIVLSGREGGVAAGRGAGGRVARVPRPDWPRQPLPDRELDAEGAPRLWQPALVEHGRVRQVRDPDRGAGQAARPRPRPARMRAMPRASKVALAPILSRPGDLDVVAILHTR